MVYLLFFIKRYWPVIGDEIFLDVLVVLNKGEDPRRFNETFLCLIPKVKKPKQASEFRPSSLCNVLFKIITKTVANRMKLVLPRIVMPF